MPASRRSMKIDVIQAQRKEGTKAYRGKETKGKKRRVFLPFHVRDFTRCTVKGTTCKR